MVALSVSLSLEEVYCCLRIPWRHLPLTSDFLPPSSFALLLLYLVLPLVGAQIFLYLDRPLAKAQDLFYLDLPLAGAQLLPFLPLLFFVVPLPFSCGFPPPASFFVLLSLVSFIYPLPPLPSPQLLFEL